LARRLRNRYRRGRKGGLGSAQLAAAVVVAAAIGFAASSAYTASNTVPATNIGQYSHTIGPNDLKPASCASLTLNHLILGGTTTGSGSDDDLVLGTSGVDTITEKPPPGTGSCIIGGLGKDNVMAAGGMTHDICIVTMMSTHKNCATVITSP
jgi:hypothetical protein